jgi:hypothetical protein
MYHDRKIVAIEICSRGYPRRCAEPTLSLVGHSHQVATVPFLLDACHPTNCNAHLKAHTYVPPPLLSTGICLLSALFPPSSLACFPTASPSDRFLVVSICARCVNADSRWSSFSPAAMSRYSWNSIAPLRLMSISFIASDTKRDDLPKVNFGKDRVGSLFGLGVAHI